MKVTCQSCGAQYQLPDDKVRGRKAKVRCKKCSQAILVDGTALDGTALDGTALDGTALGTAPAPNDAPGPSSGAAAAPDSMAPDSAVPPSSTPASAPAPPAPTPPASAAPGSDATAVADSSRGEAQAAISAPTNPLASEPIAAASAPTNPLASEPKAAASAPTNPLASEPKAAASAPTNPLASEPKAAASAPTNPLASEPKAAISAPTAPLATPSSTLHVDPAARWDDDDEATRVMVLHDDEPASNRPKERQVAPMERTTTPPPPPRRTQPPASPSASRPSQPPAPRGTALQPSATLLGGSGSGQAARRADAPSHDLFAQPATARAAGSDEQSPPNSENSVLFSLEALKAASSPIVPEKRPTPPPEDLLGLGSGSDLEAASMPLIQVEPAQPEVTEASFRRRSGTSQRGTWLALGGILAVGLGSYFGVQAYMARTDSSATDGQTQVRAQLSEATLSVSDRAPSKATVVDEVEAEREDSPRQVVEEHEAAELDELPKLREVRPSAARGTSPLAERAPAAGRAREPAQPEAREPAQPEARAASRPAQLPSARAESDTLAESTERNAPPAAVTAQAAEARESAPQRLEPEAEAPPDRAAVAPQDSPEVPASAPTATAAADSTGSGAAESVESDEVAAAAFNVDAARSALEAAASSATSCKAADGPTGTGRVLITFAVSGRVTSARVEGAPFAGTTVGGCVARAFRSASVPAFSGAPQTVAKSFTIK